MTALIILGAGGFAREVYHWIDRRIYDPIAFYVDDESDHHHHSGLRLPLIRTFEGFKDTHFIAAVGDSSGRQLLSKKASFAGLRPCDPIIHSSAVIGEAKMGRNIIVCPGSVITSNVFLSNGVLVNLNCTIGHDVIVDEYATLSPGVNISGNTRIGVRAYLGTNSSVRERVRVGNDCILGMGAVLVKDMPDGELWTGVPARRSD
jgi:sugar O-acyltransferase (sialic acid O-acetyltransferase NeuD family)